MTGSETPAITWLLSTLLVLGLGSACLTRLGEGSPRQPVYQRVFCGFLVLVAAATIVMLGLGPAGWLPSGGTLALMVLMAISDFSEHRQTCLAVSRVGTIQARD
jgi:hypothetical protein